METNPNEDQIVSPNVASVATGTVKQRLAMPVLDSPDPDAEPLADPPLTLRDLRRGPGRPHGSLLRNMAKVMQTGDCVIFVSPVRGKSLQAALKAQMKESCLIRQDARTWRVWCLNAMLCYSCVHEPRHSTCDDRLKCGCGCNIERRGSVATGSPMETIIEPLRVNLLPKK